MSGRVDTVAWLRMKADGFYIAYEKERFTEAADEIERLRKRDEFIGILDKQIVEKDAEIERLQAELEETRARMESNWSYHRFWEEKFSRHLEKIRQWEAEELERANTP